MCFYKRTIALLHSKVTLLFSRILNGIYLNYTVIEVLKLVLFRCIISYINCFKEKKRFKLIEVKLDQVLIIVISLDFRNDRREKIGASLKSNDLSFVFMNAIHGNGLNKHQLDTNIFSKISAKRLSPGSIGCILSHKKALEYFLSSDKPYCLILEDDCIIKNTFSKGLTDVLHQIPSDIDIVYLGSRNKLIENLQSWVLETMYKPLYPRYGQYAYLVSRNGAKSILEIIFPVKIILGGVDTLVGRAVSQKLIQAYHVFPDLCTADLDIESNIYNPSHPKKLVQKIEFE